MSDPTTDVIPAAPPQEDLPTPHMLDTNPHTWEGAMTHVLVALGAPPDAPVADPVLAVAKVLDAVRNQLTYEGCVFRILQLMGALVDGEQVSPKMALERVSAGLANVDAQTKYLHEVLNNQNEVLSKLAVLTKLEQGSLFSAMIPIIESWKPDEPEPEPAANDSAP